MCGPQLRGEMAMMRKVHRLGVYCGKTGPKPCAKRQTITAKVFRFKKQ